MRIAKTSTKHIQFQAAADESIFSAKDQQVVRSGIYAVWCQVASDIEASADMPGSGFEVTNECAIEVVLDADHLTTFGEPEADKVIGVAMDVWGYDKVFDWLCQNIKLR